MARKVEWTNFAVQAIRTLEGERDVIYVGSKGLATLLRVSQRRAQQIMEVIGLAEPVAPGKGGRVTREACLRYLQTVAGEQIAAEIAQRKQTARILVRLEQERIAEPPLMVAEPPPETKARMEWKGLDGLPPGIEIGRGYVTFQGISGMDIIDKMRRLCIAVAHDIELWRFCDQVERGGLSGVQIRMPLDLRKVG